ncbi:hypothetical protein [Alkalihalobacillus trypoxylicola]|uniref:Uncharacterized protein n=1 Tax=Alkalihalobacillus trypoxylicola TaxID=519424 RepID=A0A161P7Z1_9BACI|nr:hypothetical protein [Alkalihalobacillus trypoxylicola]KYG28218.1 hypothetical protein AZF04_09975 [Alkalihalobacillus trypoxylicola]
MYTYDSFEHLGTFILLRPVFITVLAAILIIFMSILIPKFRVKYNNVTPIVLASILGTILISQLLFYDSIIVDELGLNGDSVTFFLLIFTFVFAVLNPCLYLWMRSRN